MAAVTVALAAAALAAAPAASSALVLDETGALVSSGPVFSGPYAAHERKVARLRAEVGRVAPSGEVYGALIEALDQWRRAVERAERSGGVDGASGAADAGDGPSPGDLDRRIRAVADEWIGSQPGQIDGHLARLRFAEGPAERAGLLAQIERRFGESWGPLEAVAGWLRDRGDLAGAVALAERHLARRPDDAGAYASLVSDLRDQDAYRRAADVARIWLDRRPDDVEARRHVLLLTRFERTERETAEMAASLLAAIPGAPDAELCLDLESAGAASTAA
ncbi:MAG: hypothetical protein AAGF23_22140, partial [Acidobacteriota bacterium]